MVVGLRHARGAEGVGLDDVGAGGEVLLVDLADDLRARQRQQLVVAFHVLRDIRESCAAILRLAQFVALDHGAHGTVQDQDAVRQNAAKLVGTVFVRHCLSK